MVPSPDKVRYRKCVLSAVPVICPEPATVNVLFAYFALFQKIELSKMHSLPLPVPALPKITSSESGAISSSNHPDGSAPTVAAVGRILNVALFAVWPLTVTEKLPE
jgi:hypothetical protein